MRKLLLPFITCTLLSAQTWDPIPESAWAIGVKSHPEAKGAVIMEDSTRYGLRDTRHQLRVRIFSERGLAAVELGGLDEKALVSGRTLYPDGRIFTFNTQKDLATRTAKIGSGTVTQKLLIPPGVTSDCIVEIRWQEPYTYLQLGNSSRLFSHRVLRPFPVMTEIIELERGINFSTVFMGLKTHRPSSTSVDNGSFIRYSFKDLEAMEVLPFALESQRENPTLLGWVQPPFSVIWAAMGPDSFWKMVGEKVFKASMDHDKLGVRYRDLRDAIFNDLPEEPSAKAGAILTRMEARIKHGQQLTPAEFSALDRRKAKEEMNGRDLEETAKRGMTTAYGLEVLFFQLLKDAGLNPRVFYGVDRDIRPFRRDICCFNQFTGKLIGAEVPGKGYAWFQPGARNLPPGIISPDFQGTKGMILNPADGSFLPYSIPPQGALANRVDYTYSIRIGEEEQFDYRARFQGYPDYQERLRYRPLEPKEQERTLRERGDADRGYSISVAEVFHAQEPGRNIELHLAGSKELDDGNRLRIQPFPLMPPPVAFPDVWPDTRRELLVLPMNQVRTAKSNMVAPHGWRWLKPDPIDFKSPIGSVSWQWAGEGSEVEVSLEIKLERMFSVDSDYLAFRTFIGTIQEACQRTLLLERIP